LGFDIEAVQERLPTRSVVAGGDAVEGGVVGRVVVDRVVGGAVLVRGVVLVGVLPGVVK
jgi:hypothetical protein